MKRKGNNPWVTKAMHGSVARAFGEEGVYYEPYQWADERPAMQCPDGHKAYYRDSVGAYVCPSCENIYSYGEWIGTRANRNL